MKNILLIGVGGTGSKAVDIFFRKCNEQGIQSGNHVSALVFDTDAGDLQKITSAKTVLMTDNASVGTICDRFGSEYLKEWFPCDDKAVRAQELVRGASQWRKKSYLAFLNLMNKPLARSTFLSALEDMSTDPNASCEVYVIASVAGGTGSGSFIPIALYAKRYLRKILGKDPIINAMIALPDIYADSQTPENRIKVYSNAYAILRELNAINLVSRNYNAGVAAHKKAPITFRIGDEREPSVGLLFDASNPRYWTPEAAPFSQVFLLDRIPGLNTVAAHDMVLANSLYTILCTDIGSAFDSEFSNHELLRSQNNGSNAIYAGVSTAQIRFPKDSILDYLAYKKTVDSCDNEWLTLHRAVENAIHEKEQQAKACKLHYTMKPGEYASIVGEQVMRLEDEDNDGFVSIMERCVYAYDEDQKKIEGKKINDYMELIDGYIGGRITNPAVYKNEIKDKLTEEEKITADAVASAGEDLKDLVQKYYEDCVDVIRRTSNSTADAILTLDKKKQEFVGKDMSVVERLLKNQDKYIHPVAAMVQLCALRHEITEKINGQNVNEWEDLRKRSVDSVPGHFLRLSEDAPAITESAIQDYYKGKKKSAYVNLGATRFEELEDYDADSAKGSNINADRCYLWQDTLNIMSRIYAEAQALIRSKVYNALASNLDLLIAKYSSFFNRFIKEKEDLEEQKKTAHRKDAGNVDSIVNVYSSMADKDAIYKAVVDEGGPVTDTEIKETDHIVGLGVFTSAFNSAACELAQDDSWNENDSGNYRSLFNNMVKAYREFIGKSESFGKVASYNVVEAIVEKCSAKGDSKDAKKAMTEAFNSCFSVAQDLATPSLRVDTSENMGDLVRPSNIMVFMMSKNTGRYLKKHADELNLPLPADQSNENEVIRSCAIEFIRRYSGNNSARVSLVEKMSDQVLYCTGEIMDINPLRISKFNELGEDNVYFKNYTLALANYRKYNTDMWNPHLGNNLHKRGYLPYMNLEKERECDEKVVKALLYGFMNKKLTFTGGKEDSVDYYYFAHEGNKIFVDTNHIGLKRIAQLVAWLRNEDELVEEWSTEFDKEITSQKNRLPSIASDSPTEIGRLEAALTSTPFMRLLTDKLYVDEYAAKSKTVRANRCVKYEGGKLTDAFREGPTALDFAYMVRTCEEQGRDCDDAERILTVVYDVFKEMCAFRANPQAMPERFIKVYGQQLGKIYEAIASSKSVYMAGSECYAYFSQFATWLSQNSTFKSIPVDMPMNAKGEVNIDATYDYNKTEEGNSVKNILKFVANGYKVEESTTARWGRAPKAQIADAPADEADETDDIDTEDEGSEE